MSTPSPVCTVADGGGAPASTTPTGVNVTAGNTITIALLSNSGVDIWAISVLGTDELSTAPVLTINSTAKTATYTAPAVGSATIFKSVVTNAATGFTASTTFGVYVPTSGRRVGANFETIEGDNTFGWAAKLNPIIRTGGGGGSTPTGTGFRHVTAGTEDGAAALVQNADVGASAGIVGSKLAANLVITTSAAAGTNPAASGPLRIPYQGYLVSRDAAGTGDFPLIANDNGGFVTLGDASVNNGYVFKQAGGGAMYFRFNATDALTLTVASLAMNAPIIGDSANTSPYAAHGCGTVAEGDAPRTEAAAIYCFANIIYTGALTAGRTVTFPQPASLAKSYVKSIFNSTTGGFALTFTTGAGTTVAIAATKTAFLHFDSTGVRRLTADV